MTEARPDPYRVLRHVSAMDPPGRRSISTAEAQAVLDEVAQYEADLLTVEGQRADLAERLFVLADAVDGYFAAGRSTAALRELYAAHEEDAARRSRRP